MRLAKVTLIVLLAAIILCGCSQPVEKLPAVKVEFMHYNISGTHLLKINYAKAAYINKSEAPERIYLPSDVPFPGIHVFAYTSKGVTPITWVPIETEGDNITAYIGFRSPEDVPKEGEVLIVVVDAVDRMGRSYATDSTRIAWNPE
ncbi:hypothetical protein [Archaeoglobus veneficus]|uniref:Uncharacterized protein n=1 Tax=Archaeoglobus veneficus (strain DSM 11195 / SNP6) TaxID=693661 RepID=F2KR15_ARCVS|nr:hypothetical protein [Archaeoglobus veneficus]AEA47821.1 hypothetical protein Arcve_1825 [Archaeoglobus veneficus SNP6]